MALKILLADDSMTAQNMGKKILSDAGYEVIAVSNGAAALKKIQSEKPDIIVLDVYMPGYTGLEVCEKVKTNPETTAIPVLLTVGKMEPFRPEDANRVKADGILVKPFEASDLTVAIANISSHGPTSNVSRAKIEKKDVPAPMEVVVQPKKPFEDTVRLSREELKQIREASYQDWGTGSIQAQSAPASAPVVAPAESALAAETPQEAVIFDPKPPLSVPDLSASANTPALSDTGLHAIVSWSSDAPAFHPDAEMASEAPKETGASSANSTMAWEITDGDDLPTIDVPFPEEAFTVASAEMFEVPPLSEPIPTSFTHADANTPAWTEEEEPKVEAHNVEEHKIESFSEANEDDTASFAGPLPELELTAVQRDQISADPAIPEEPGLVPNTDSEHLAEFATHFGIEMPTPVSTDELHIYVEENNRSTEDILSTLLQNHHVANNIPDAELPDLVAQEHARAEEIAHPEAANEALAELLHSDDFDVQALNELTAHSPEYSESPFAHQADAIQPENGSAAAYTDFTQAETAEASIPYEPGVSFENPTQAHEPGSQSGVFHEWHQDVAEAPTPVMSTFVEDTATPAYASPIYQPQVNPEYCSSNSEAASSWEAASQCAVSLAQPPSETEHETESGNHQTMISAVSFPAESLVSAVVANFGSTAEPAKLTEEAIGRAFSKVLERFKDQLVTEIVRELGKD